MFGKGLIKGLAVTGKESISKRMTEKYPEEKPYLAACYRGGNFQFNLDACIGCGLCAKACPNKAIEVVTAKDEDGKRRVTEYWVDRQYCLFCGFCVDACPKAALHFTMDFETATYSRFEVPVNLVVEPHLDHKASVYGSKPAKPAVKKPAAAEGTVKAAVAEKPAAGQNKKPVGEAEAAQAEAKQPQQAVNNKIENQDVNDVNIEETPVAKPEKGVE